MLVINLEKARVVAHKIRRFNRQVEFQPHDEVIAKQIPGPAAQNAEASRQAIREKYAALQIQIDAATTVEELTALTPGYIV